MFKKLRNEIGRHKKWAARFLLLETLNFLMTVGMIGLTNSFLGNKNEFLLYGYQMARILLNSTKDECNPMEEVKLGLKTILKCSSYSYNSPRLHLF